MDDPVKVIPHDMTSIIEALNTMREAVSQLGDAVEKASDDVYTHDKGGKSYVIDTSRLEEEAEEDVEFLKDH